SESNQQGNVCIDLGRYQLKPLFAESSPVAPNLQDWQAELLASPAVGRPGEICPLILEEERLYLYRYWFYESELADSILRRARAINLADPGGLKAMLAKLYPSDSYQQQKTAVELAVKQRFTLISGGPGTGKTTTVINILRALLAQQADLRIELTAPTGKAAARLMEAIRQRIDAIATDDPGAKLLPQRASTIHRLLGYNKTGVKFDNQHLLPLDCIVIDEASMIDLPLMYHLVDALPPEARVILLGDRDQLASVAAGSVLADISGLGLAINNSHFPLAGSIAFLRDSYRFDAASEIGLIASQVNMGNSKAVLELLAHAKKNVAWKPNISDQFDNGILQHVLDQYRSVIQAESIEQAFSAFESFRALCAVHNGVFGISEINRRVELAMRAQGWLESTEQYHGKAILINSNDYESGLFNGDIGLLWRGSDERLYACFRDLEQGIRRVSINNLPDHSPAWAMTVHKSQGSEFDSVLLILPGIHQQRALSRELLYTGITRARSSLMIYASEDAINYACQNTEQRHSGLARKLGWPAA
ncbi:MAG: exodeoxyribonuclease V subunit alpha, partial [Gammaproteobacteria bacterium]|nr:exodeoxyribonuclease V subunit alpha [Gammaproteobacteria bacterium]